MIITIQGLKIKTSCRYIKFTYAKYLNIYEEDERLCLHIDFPKRLKSDRIIDKRIEILEPRYLKETDYIKLSNTHFTLNGVEFIKTVQHDYVFSQYIVESETQFIMRYNEYRCEIIIPKILYYRKDKYLQLLEYNPYIKVLDSKKFTKFNNFYSINISNRDINLVSNNEFEFSTKKKYTAYLLSSIDVLQSFKNRITEILKDRSIEYVRYPIDEKASSVNRIIWRVTEMGRQLTRKTVDPPLRYSVLQTMHLDFKLSTPNLVVFDDFKTRYNNLDLLTDFTTFDTKDKLGIPWKSNVWWSPLDSQFNQDYAMDEQSNLAQESSFSCDIQYYTVYDESFVRIQNIILDIKNQSDTVEIVKI